MERRLTAALHAAGRRLTRQRRLVMEVLEEAEEHLDAETIHDRARARDPRISLATVYRTLALLKEIGLVEEHRLGEGHAHFEAVQEVPHYHFTCLGCGRVIEFDAPQIAQVVRALSEREHLRITDVHLFLTGYCAQCQQDHSKEEQRL
ncbi:MAG TPA: transcriptional repressor [Chloroflexi bacterium]|nr:transcriptional repressor [Chloroflexota bacterium]